MRIAVIGDVHGHLAELLTALDHAERSEVDRIILLGDLIDRGPRSLACLHVGRTWTFWDSAGRKRPVEVVKGNHEDAYVRTADGIPKPGRETVSFPEDRPLYNRLSRENIDWMRELPTYVRVEELNLTCLHGGVTPTQFDLDDAGDWVLRTRYLGDEGEPLRSTRSSDWFWAESYNGRFGTIVSGHEGHAAPTAYYCELGHVPVGKPSAICIDGEGFRRLHGVIIDDEGQTGFTIPYGRPNRISTKRLATQPVRVHDMTWTERQDGRQRLLWPEAI